MTVLLGPIAFLALSATTFVEGTSGVPEAIEAVAPDPTDELLRQYDEAQFAGHWDQALAIADKFEPDNPGGRAFVEALRASALLGLKREADARRAITESERLAPASADASRVIFLGALLSDHAEYSAAALDRMLARAPDVVRELDWGMVRYFLSHEPKGQDRANEDRRVTLARIGYGGDTEVGHWRVADAVEILVKRGDFAAAGELVQFVNEPEAIENMLIQRRYAPLWPQLQTVAGPHLEKIRAASAGSAEREYAAAPDDREKLSNYANALRHAGRLDEAVALRSKLPTSIAAMSSADEPTGWAVNNVALAMYEAGRADDADALFAMLNDAPMSPETWRVSMKINRLELLVFDGRFDQAWPLIEPTAKTQGSPYAEQLVRRLKYCTLSGLGRKAEAANYLPELLKRAEDAPGPTIDGLLCGGELDRAETVALDMLKKKDSFAEDFVRQLQAHPLTSDDPSVWQDRWRQLRARPAVQREFDRLGRDMPPELLASKPHRS